MTGHQKYTNELTNREQEVLECLMDGLDYKGTAKELCITLATLNTHKDNIFQKKGVNTLQQLLVNEYKRLLGRAGIEKEFKRIRQQAYQQMIGVIQKKLNEVTNE